MAHVVCIDDDGEVRSLLETIAAEQGHASSAARTLAEGFALCQIRQPDVVFLDLLLPDGGGLQAIPRLRGLPRSPEIIVLSDHDDPDGVETALRHGVAACLPKPLARDKADISLRRALACRSQRHEAQEKRLFLRPGIVGASPALCDALELAAQASAGTVSVLIVGETGTGKGCFARAVHANSRRAGKPFVTVDCAALCENLVGSQLFGHTRGAFTGADREQPGLVAQAHGGVLFLDEIGDMPLAIQRAFLRVLEEHRFRPLGASSERSSDFRVIAATNRDLDEMVRLGLFRADLLYRLRGLTLRLPPLRERHGDIERLAWHFLDAHNLGAGQQKTLGGDFLEALEDYAWPGNVRELSHAMDRAVAASGEEVTLYATHLPVGVRVQAARRDLERAHGSAVDPASEDEGFPTLKEYRRRLEALYISRLLERTGGEIRAAAAQAGLSRGHLYELLRRHGIERV